MIWLNLVSELEPVFKLNFLCSPVCVFYCSIAEEAEALLLFCALATLLL